MAARKTPTSYPQDRLHELLLELNNATLAEKAAKLNADLRKRVIDLRIVSPRTRRRLMAEYAIFRHSGRNRRRLFPRLKTAKREFGSVERRYDPPSVRFPVSAEQTLADALATEQYQFIRFIPARAELDLDAMHADPEGAQAALKVLFYQEEHLRVRVPANRQSYVLSGRKILDQLRGLEETREKVIEMWQSRKKVNATEPLIESVS